MNKAWGARARIGVTRALASARSSSSSSSFRRGELLPLLAQLSAAKIASACAPHCASLDSFVVAFLTTTISPSRRRRFV